MDTNPVSALTNLAIEAFRSTPLSGERHGFRPGITGDPILDGAPELHETFPDVFSSENMVIATASLRGDPALADLATRENENDPFVLSEVGGSRLSLEMAAYGLLDSAMRLMYFRSLHATEGGLASLVIENYEELKRAARGEEVRTHSIFGLTGVQLEQGIQITTPWGTVKPAPEPGRDTSPWLAPSRQSPTTAVLVRQRLTKFQISREDNPSSTRDIEAYFAEERRIYELLPLAFALATDNQNRCAPTITFSSSIDPFTAGRSSSSSVNLRTPGNTVVIGAGQVASIEDWARTLNNEHVEGLQVAARRTVSAIAERHDKADALIDAVTVWETLVGTRSETVFRVTAALAKLLEPDPAARGALRKRLGEIYDIRSRIVHGDVVDHVVLTEHADRAIDIALEATRALYKLGGDWLMMKSTARADRLILGD